MAFAMASPVGVPCQLKKKEWEERRGEEQVAEGCQKS
jgi:hypothetical protein